MLEAHLAMSGHLSHHRRPHREDIMAGMVLYSETLYPDDAVERGIFGPDIGVVFARAARIAEIPDSLAAEAEGLMIFRHFLTGDDLARFPRLRAVVRMGVGYDRLDRAACARRAHRDRCKSGAGVPLPARDRDDVARRARRLAA
jgi:hypothetical protein